MRKKALVLSPFATVPLDAGQRKRANQTTQMLRDLGYEITFLLYAFEEGWKTRANEAWLEEMRDRWDEVILLRANPKVGLPARSGWTHELDEWWDDVLETHLAEIFAYRFFDVFVIHNVWLSKAFDLAPLGTVRILDAHDVFSSRLTYFEETNTKPEFFITDARSEALGVSRADIVLGIQEQDTEWFARHSQALALCVPYNAPRVEAERSARTDYLHKDKVVFGFLGSGHIFNVRGLSTFCSELMRLVGRMAAPVELRIGGDVCQSVTTRGPWTLCGRVADEEEFFDGVDVMVAPVFEGSGFKVKMADACARGLPIIAASHAAIGMNFDGRVIAEDAKELAAMTVNIALSRPRFRDLLDISQRAHLDLTMRESRGVQKLKRRIGTWRSTILYDATGLSMDEASCVLLGWSGAFHLMRSLARQLVVVPEPLRAALERNAPAGVFFVPEDEVTDHARQIWRWITVRNAGPAKWGAQPEQIWIDREWRRAFTDTDMQPDTAADEDSANAMFWHNITWDPMVQSIVKAATSALGKRRGNRNPGESALAATRRCSEALAGPMASLFPEFWIARLDSFDDFFELAIRAASGNLARLVVAEPGHRARVHVLRELCRIRGIDFVGPTAQGGLSTGKASDTRVKRNYDRFERQWRLRKDECEANGSTAPETGEQKSPRPELALKLLSTQLVEQLTIAATDRIVPRNNLYYLEYDSLGTPFRWTGPHKTSSFSLYLERRNPLRLEFTVLAFRDLLGQAPVSICVDGSAVEHAMTPRSSGGFVASALIPPRSEATPCPTEITVTVQDVVRASAEDDRLLGVAFSELNVAPASGGERKAPAPARTEEPPVARTA